MTTDRKDPSGLKGSKLEGGQQSAGGSIESTLNPNLSGAPRVEPCTEGGAPEPLIVDGDRKPPVRLTAAIEAGVIPPPAYKDQVRSYPGPYPQQRPHAQQPDSATPAMPSAVGVFMEDEAVATTTTTDIVQADVLETVDDPVRPRNNAKNTVGTAQDAASPTAAQDASPTTVYSAINSGGRVPPRDIDESIQENNQKDATKDHKGGTQKHAIWAMALVAIVAAVVVTVAFLTGGSTNDPANDDEPTEPPTLPPVDGPTNPPTPEPLPLETKLLASYGDGTGNAAVDDHFGWSVAMHGETVVVGANWADYMGSAYVFTHNGTSWNEQAKLVASDGSGGDEFGHSVAIDGDTLVVGCPQDEGGGSAFVFTRTESTWSEQAKLLVASSGSDDRFGFSVAIAGDTVVVGAPGAVQLGDGTTDGNGIGSVHVFLRSGSSWTEQAILTSGVLGFLGNEFGFSVAIAGDEIVVGTPYDDYNGWLSGAAVVFLRVGSTWTQQAELTASDDVEFNQFGTSVAIDGDTIAVGAMNDDGFAVATGSTYVFIRIGDVWARQAKLTPSTGIPGGQFGGSVAITGDWIIVGADQDDGSDTTSGSSYVFRRAGGTTLSATWVEQAKLSSSDGSAGDQFGFSVAIDDGNMVVVVGAPGDDDKGLESGAAYLYDLDQL